jgi:hypothetical protein
MKDQKIEPLQQTVSRLIIENNLMRYLIAQSDMACMYCHLPKAEISRCEFGFPGCSRADDMMVVNDC